MGRLSEEEKKYRAVVKSRIESLEENLTKILLEVFELEFVVSKTKKKFVVPLEKIKTKVNLLNSLMEQLEEEICNRKE